MESRPFSSPFCAENPEAILASNNWSLSTVLLSDTQGDYTENSN